MTAIPIPQAMVSNFLSFHPRNQKDLLDSVSAVVKLAGELGATPDTG